MDITGFPLNCFIYGICAEASFRGMIQSGPELVLHLRGEEPGSVFLVATLFAFNTFAFLNMAMFLPVQNLLEHDCVSLNKAALFTWHVFMIIFDGFVMFKSYVCVRKNFYYKIICILAFLYRVGLGIADLTVTGGVWNPVNKTCDYETNGLVGFHYTIADIICDVFATVAAVIMLIQNMAGLTSAASVFKEVMSENVFRSVFVLVVNAIILYFFLYPNNLDLVYSAWGMQNYVYICLMNMELSYS
ncbi:hypothetical protein BC830DRAFT_475144 [Chytriomyces sp. MP71]|nr:hypothetical protein BC830DRAFT_475144 [Chytriomyces sp. MP71]